HLNKRNIAMFSTDIDSFDFKLQPPEALVKGVMDKLEKKGKGILLMHDIHKNTAKALPLLLTQLKDKGYKVVHLTAKGEVATLPEYDALIEKDAKGLPQIGAERPTASVVRTIGGDAPASETGKMESGRLEPAVALPVAPPAAAPVGKAAELTPPPAAAVPVAVAPAATAPVAPAAAPVAAQAAAPVATVGAPVTTSSISTERPAGSGEPPKAEAVPAAAQPKTMTEKVQAIWEMWFGK
ncbi:MAG: polysaccharide deacetylase family protein, partial [Hyphomicrobium sp.]